MLKPDDALPGEVDCPHLGPEYNPLEGPQLENPYPFYARARREGPVFFSERLQAWIVTRYEDIRSVLLRPDIFSSKDTLRPVVTWVPEVFQVLATCYGFVPMKPQQETTHIPSLQFRGLRHLEVEWDAASAI